MIKFYISVVKENLKSLFTASYCVIFLVATLVCTKVIALPFELVVDAGVLIGIYPFLYCISDVTIEVWGYKAARMNGLCALGSVVFTVGALTLAGILPYVEDPLGLKNMGNVLSGTLIVSLIAFAMGDWIDSRVYHKVRGNFKSIWNRCIVSSIIGELADATLFLSIMNVWVWHLEIPLLIALILVSTTMKLSWEVMVSPLTVYLAKKIKKYVNEPNR